ncbi:MAG: YjgP/YjgQ family permease [Flavobacteriales bacterium]|nr:YjgP/YjgQ family permease [Flavobacteriales bacterium]
MKKLDIFIIKNYLSTFVFSVVLFISIVIVFDISEKIDDFLDKEVPLTKIFTEYYLNFIPYFINLLSPLITFIAVIFFTSKMASNTEFIAIMSGGISYNRILVPYFISSAILCLFTYYLSGYVIPPANKVRIEFENKYMKAPRHGQSLRNHKRIESDTYVYIAHYNAQTNTGNNFSIERFDEHKLISKTIAKTIKWDSTNQAWSMTNWLTRDLKEDFEIITQGKKKDTIINLHPKEFKRRITDMAFMTNTELAEFIELEKERGGDRIEFYIVEQYKRGAFPFSTMILTLIGVSLASRKSRGGIGLHIGIGLGISFIYILLMQISTTFATYSNVTPLLAVWIPNIIFLSVGIALYSRAQK